MTGLHMGALHPVEMWLTVILAVAPFVVLWVAVRIANRREQARAAGAAGPTETVEPVKAAEPGPVSSPPRGS